MTPTHKILLSSALWLVVAPVLVKAQSFDTSGTAGLTGRYLFRYVNFFTDENGNLAESCSLTGTITFDGVGTYKLSSTQLYDSAASGQKFCTSLGGGTYGVQSNGMAQLDNPLYPATLFGTFSKPVVIASSTEDDYFDLFIAVQAPGASFSNGNFSGDFTVGTLDFLKASSSFARQGYFNLKADGQGNIAAFVVNGSLANVRSGETISQNVAASTYSLSGTAGGTMTFPGSSDNETEIVSGEKVLYVSDDGNWLVGGSATGSDMFFGFRAPSGTSSNSLLSGTYFVAGMENSLAGASFGAPDFLDAFYGSINTSGNGTLIWHERYDDVLDLDTYDATYQTPINLAPDGSYYDGTTYTYLAGSKGAAAMLIGSNQQFSLIIGVRATSAAPAAAPWINPIGVTDAANYTPITNGYAPGELVSLYGVFAASTQTAGEIPIPTILGGLQVLVNGRAAPLTLVSQNQIGVLIPYEVAGDSFATFQVVAADGSKSNPVTVYLANSAPGIYSADESGVGPGAILHSNYSPVTDSHPAIPGETVQMFMTGLGAVSPQVADGAAASISPVSASLETPLVLLEDEQFDEEIGAVEFAGLTPGLAGLYQVNFTLPASGLENGDIQILLVTDEALNSMSTIRVSGFKADALVRSGRASMPRGRFVAGAVRHRPHAKSVRRALPDRPKE